MYTYLTVYAYVISQQLCYHLQDDKDNNIIVEIRKCSDGV